MSKDAVYVNFESNDFISARKNLLSSAIETIRLLKRYKEYKQLRLKERHLKNELRKEIKEINTKVNGFIDSIPKIKEEMSARKKKVRSKAIGVKATRTTGIVGRNEKIKFGRKAKPTLDAELQEIKEKLASLG